MSSICVSPRRLRRRAVWLATAAIAVASLAGASAAQAQNVVTVTTTNKTGAGSLSAAITTANATPGTTIVFSSSLAGQTITLTSELPLLLGTNTTINGGGDITINGAGLYRGFFIGGAGQAGEPASSSATIENLTIRNAVAQGGTSAYGGGGGAGLGGAIFVSSTGSLTLSNVNLAGNAANGGAGGVGGYEGGGGGGMGGNGGLWGAGGGFEVGANGGNVLGGSSTGGAGAFTGGASGGNGALSGVGGANGGGGGGDIDEDQSGGGGVNGSSTGAGGFGGGGGAGLTAGNGGFGGGGAGVLGGETGGNGGFGGGGGGGYDGSSGGAGGFGGGNGGGGSSSTNDGGGGGAGMGGAIFVQQGGNLVLSGGSSIYGNGVTGGAGGSGNCGCGGAGTPGADGSAFGSGLFLQGSSVLAFQPGAGQVLTVSDVIADQTGSGGSGSWGVSVNGAGTLVLSGANTYSGGTTLTSGTLAVGDNSALGTGALSMAAGTTLSFASGGNFTLANNIAISGDPTFTPPAGTTQTLSGVISDGASPGFLDLQGPGTLVLTGTNTYSGGTSVEAGTLQLSGAGTLGAPTGTLSVSGGVLDLGGTAQTTGALTLTGGTIQDGVLTSSAYDVQAGTISAVLAGAGALTKTGSGVVVLSGANTYSGGTTLTSGTLVVGISSALGTGALSMAAGTTLSIAGGNFTLANNISISGDTTFTPAAGTTQTISGVISDGASPGVLDLQGPGTLVLTGANTYSGGTSVEAGTLQLSGAGTLGASTGTLSVSGGVLDLGGMSQTTGVLTLTGGTIQDGVLTSSAFDVQAGTISAALAGAGGLTKTGSGVVVLSAANTFTGGVSVEAGTLQLSGAGSIAASSGVTADGTFDISGTTVGASITTLSGSGSVMLGDQTLTLTNASGTFSGVIADGGLAGGTGGSLTIAGGTETLTGANTYTGVTTVNAGAALQLGSGGTTGSVAGAVVDNGTLTFDRSNAYAVSGDISGSGALIQAGTGTTVLNGDDTLTGQTLVSAGMLEVGDAAHPNAVLDSLVGGVTVGAAGALAGYGTILGAVTNTSGGVVAPGGGGIGTLTVGAYSQGAGGALAVEVGPAGASELKSLGSASLGGKLDLAFAPGTYAPHLYPIVAGAPVSGTFSSVSVSGAPGAGVAYGLAYGSNQVDLIVAPSAGAQIYGGVSTATLDRAQGFASLVEDRFGDAGCANGAEDKTGAACHGMGAWAQAIATTDRVGGSSTGYGFTNSGAGFLGGVDRRWDALSAGVAFGYEQDDLGMGAASAKASGASYFGSLYGRWVVDRAWIDGQAFYMHSDWSVSRAAPGYGVASSSPDGDTAGFLVQVSAPLKNGDLRPYVRFSYAEFTRDSTTESGVGPLGFAVASASTTSALAEAGVLLSHSWAAGDGREVSPALQLGVQNNLGDRSSTVQGGLEGVAESAFTQYSVQVPQVVAAADASLKVKLNQSFELSADLRGRFGGSQTDEAASLGGVFRF